MSTLDKVIIAVIGMVFLLALVGAVVSFVRQ